VTPIFHITHIRCIDSIIAAGGLWSPNHRPATSQPPVVISHLNIQSRRAKRAVPAGPGGVLHDYAPFYFGARSPMLYANHAGKVTTNPDGQAAIAYLVSCVEDVLEEELPWVFTDGHADVSLTTFYDDLSRLADLDWEAIRAMYWADTPECPDRKRLKQAEFLVHRFFPMKLVREVAVLNDQARKSVGRSLIGHGLQIPLVVRPEWYY
jgi:hypothetical protein